MMSCVVVGGGGASQTWSGEMIRTRRKVKRSSIFLFESSNSVRTLLFCYLPLGARSNTTFRILSVRGYLPPLRTNFSLKKSQILCVPNSPPLRTFPENISKMNWNWCFLPKKHPFFCSKSDLGGTPPPAFTVKIFGKEELRIWGTKSAK